MKPLLAPILLLIPCAAFAAESANYSITPQSQASGSRSISTHYTLDASTDAGGAATSTTYTLRSGFAGALHNPVAIEINASPLTMSPRLADRTYHILTNTTLDGGSWEKLGTQVVSDLGTQRTVTDTDATDERKFYKVEVTKP